MDLEGKTIYGEKIRTSNQQLEEVVTLWNKVPAMNLKGDLYAVYHNYESDYQGAYDLLVGSEQNDYSDRIQIQGGNYLKLVVEPAIIENVGKTWAKIWQDTTINQQRTYQTDVEHYATDGTITIYLSVK